MGTVGRVDTARRRQRYGRRQRGSRSIRDGRGRVDTAWTDPVRSESRVDTVDRVDTGRVDAVRPEGVLIGQSGYSRQGGYGTAGGESDQSEWIRWQQAVQKRIQ